MPIDMQKFALTITLTEPMLGTVPKNKDVYARYIASKARELKTEELEDEVNAVPEDIENSGWTGFHEDDKGIFVYDYLIKGFLKEAGNVLKEVVKTKALKSKIENFVFIEPRKIRLKKQPDGVLERPLKANTPQGQRVALARSDYVDAGTMFECTVSIITPGPISEPILRTLLDYGKLKGLGQNRNSGYGRFTYELSPAKA